MRFARELAKRRHLNPHIRTLRLYVVRMIHDGAVHDIQPPISRGIRAESPEVGVSVDRKEGVADVWAVGGVGVRLEVKIFRE